MKQCRGCGQDKDESEFYRRSNSDQPRARCKVCVNTENLARQAANPEKYNARTNAWREKHPGRTTANIRAWQLRNPERHKGNIYRYRYKIDLVSLWGSQGGNCAACGEPMLREGRKPESLCVDHDRSCCSGRKSCGKCVRGLIHRNCNLVLGYAKDDPQILRSAVTYLEQWLVRGPTHLVLDPSVPPSLAPVVASDVSLGSSRAWQLRNPKRFKAQAYKSRFRVDFEALWQAQSGKCASCHKPMVREGKDPQSACVDHDRFCCSGKKSCGGCVRGLIHRNCNLVLGYAKDDLKVLRGAVEYLERWAARSGDSASRFSVHTACKGENQEFDYP